MRNELTGPDVQKKMTIGKYQRLSQVASLGAINNSSVIVSAMIKGAATNVGADCGAIKPKKGSGTKYPTNSCVNITVRGSATNRRNVGTNKGSSVLNLRETTAPHFQYKQDATFPHNFLLTLA